MNRRELFPMLSVAALGAAVAGCKVEDAPEDSSFKWTASKHIELPLEPGDEIVGLASHNGELMVATRRGEIYRISLGL